MHRLTLISAAATPAQRRGSLPLDETITPGSVLDGAGIGRRFGRIDRVLTSPRRAAQQTAEALGFSAAADPRLDDLDFGRWAGLALGDVAASEPEAVSLWLAEAAAAPHGGESRADLAVRVGDLLAEAARDSGHMVAVTHGAVIRAALLLVLDAPPEAFWRIDVAPLAVADLRHDGRRWALRSLG